MKILMVGSLFKPMPTLGYGGVERVCYWLAQALTDLGEEVILTGPKGTQANFCRVIESSLPAQPNCSPKNYEKYFREITSLIPDQVDIIHGHAAWAEGILKYLKKEMKMLCTIHGWREPLPKRASPIFISDSQRNEYDQEEADFIYDPINLNEFEYLETKEDYMFFIGKIDWEVKGVRLAIELSQRTGIPLVVAGPGRAPKIKGNSKISFVGEVHGETKARLLAKAKCLIYPTRWPEPFGLAPVEAMASGTPAIVLRNGAMPEVVKDGYAGFVCADEAELEERIFKINVIEPKNCRDWVEKNFESHLIAKKYLDRYRKILSQ